jgi:hypothetical protein
MDQTATSATVDVADDTEDDDDMTNDMSADVDDYMVADMADDTWRMT